MGMSFHGKLIALAMLAGSATPATAAALPDGSGGALFSSKSAAILGGMSALERIAAQQAGLAVEAPSALPQPAARALLLLTRTDLDFGTPAAAPVAADRPDIFGSVALAVSRTPLDTQWRRAGSAPLRDGPWSQMLASLDGATPAERLERVNFWVNRNIDFVEDRDQYGRNDVWVDGAQSLRRGRGDCEDYALAKMQLLRAAGVAADDMYLSIVKDLVRRADHAVLVVRMDGRFVVLDNNTDMLTDASAAQDYRPVFTYSPAGAWTHGYVRTAYAKNGNAGAGGLSAAR